MNYYNEIDPHAAQTIRNLIAAGHIPRGYVDTRDIRDVHASDLAGFRQCHFFAGVAVWAYALRRAGVPDDANLWTGSCPCQPFSAAGSGAGMADERHLWPHWHHLIRECRPARILGEQVASRDAGPWIDLVQTDVEAMGYAFGAVPFPSAGVGAPHIRDRLYWVADAHGSARGEGGTHIRGRVDRSDAQPWAGLGGGGLPHRLADTASEGPQGGERAGQRDDAQREAVERGGAPGGLGHTGQHDAAIQAPAASDRQSQTDRPANIAGRSSAPPGDPGPVNGFWSAADWLFCRDGKWRPVEPGTFPLAHGAAARVGRLRAYGNAINAEAAETFIRAVTPC